MPVYEYICRACEHEFEREQRISENPVKKCPACGAMKAKRLISRTSFVLKGGGWYSDLYSSSRGDSGKSERSAESSAESTAESSAKSEPSSTTKSSSDKKGDSSSGSKAAA
jgi:putative FmdB family regulatory protein